MLQAGQVGYVVLGMRSPSEARIGETFHHPSTSVVPCAGFKPVKPMVFSGLYPIDTSEFLKLGDALDKLCLNDSSVTVDKESSSTLGQGFRLGFLGTLHLDVFRERLEEEYGTHVINTAPSVPYRLHSRDRKEVLIVSNPAHFPEGLELSKIEYIEEPMVQGRLIFPDTVLGSMMELCGNARGQEIDYDYIDDDRLVNANIYFFFVL